MKKKESVLHLQEMKYEFPYHFIPRKVNGSYAHALYLPGGHEYLCYILKVIDRLKNLDFQNLLDLGCGDGRFLFECTKEIRNKKLYGADKSEKAIAFARILNPGITFFTADFSQPLTESLHYFFDVVTLIDVLEHIDPAECENFMYNVHSVLKIEGHLLITVPTKNLKVGRKHFRHFNLSSLSELLTPYFELREFDYLNRKSWQTALIRRFFSNRFFILNNKTMAGFIFRWYRKNFLESNERNGKRLFIFCRKK